MKKFFVILVFFVFSFLWINGILASDELNFEDLTQWEMIVIVWSEEEDDDSFVAESSEKIISLPLKHTQVNWEISGFVARTTVIQEFQNPFEDSIEAIYNFPLPNEASVDSMIMKIWERTIVWEIKKREEAEQMYEQAKTEGKTASLLNQERPNIFTQKVANIMPWDDIKIEISYFETLKYDSWKYTYTFPMVVWPRYNPPSVTDASNITSTTISADTRNWHTIDVSLIVNAWVNIKWLKSISHDVDVTKISDSQAEVTLQRKDEIPNKDFVFSYDVADKEPQIGIITYKDKDSEYGYFTLIAEPQKSPTREDIRNKEIVFVLDTSGSMSWRPIVSLKKVMEKAISDLDENDYFNIFSFSNNVTKMFSKSSKATDDAKNKWLNFVNSISAWWWTVMDTPLKEALKENWDESDRMRIIIILTDGDVWNESELLSIVKKNIWENRIFTLWIDEAPNRYLLDRISEIWNWKTTYIQWSDDIDEKVEEFYNNFKSPVLTDIKLDWDGLEVTDILPYSFSDLYAWQPLYVYWKYSWKLDKQLDVEISWIMWNNEYSETIPFTFKSEEEENSSLAWLWARKKIKEIYKDNYFEKNGKLEQEVTQLWLDYSIMTEFTSFVAIDDQIRNENWNSTKIEVPTYEVEWKLYEEVFDNNIFSKSKYTTNNLSPSGLSVGSINSSIEWSSINLSTVLLNWLSILIWFLYLVFFVFFLIWLYKLFTAKWDKDKRKIAYKILIKVIILFISIFLINSLIYWVISWIY